MEAEKIRFVYGDSTKRETYPLPGSYRKLQDRARQVLGCDCEIWHDAMAGGRLESRASLRVKNDVDYGMIQDDDVVILVDDKGKKHSVGSLYTTYGSDYVSHPPMARQIQGPPYKDAPLPDITHLAYKTTYANDFQGKQGPPDDRRHGRSLDPSVTAPFDGVTTYKDHYKPHHLTVVPDDPVTDQNFGSPYKNYETTYKRHFRPFPTTTTSQQQQQQQPGEPNTFPTRPSGAPWRPTEYTEEFVHKTSDPWTGDLSSHDDDPVNLGSGTTWKSTYKTDFPRPPVRPSGRLHYDPELLQTMPC